MTPRLHRLSSAAEAVEPPKAFTYPFCYTPHPLCVAAVEQICAFVQEQPALAQALDEGKMLGTLVVRDADGVLGFLAAYSGNLSYDDAKGFFVPAVFDFLSPNGYFKTEEARISEINHQIASLEDSDEFSSMKSKLADFETDAAAQMAKAKADAAARKKARHAMRASGTLSPSEEEEIIRESQFDKANLKRLVRGIEAQRAELQQDIDAFSERIAILKTQRKQQSAQLQSWLFRKFVMLNSRGEKRDLATIFLPTAQGVPPAGAGECAAPKLLQYAFLHHLKPLCMAEFWWGKSPTNEVRHHLHYYPACQGKCFPILTYMLEGMNVDANPLAQKAPEIEVLYEDEYLLAVNKPASLLSAPGKAQGDSVLQRLRDRYPNLPHLNVAHRLDQATSGVLLVAKDMLTFQQLQKLFAERKVQKTYIAILSAIPKEKDGRITLPISPSYENRPMQFVDTEHGKPAVTDYKVLSCAGAECRVEFHPHTGRTHQIRVHAASPLGLNAPIKGDLLYGNASAQSAQRLHLHAHSITFRHPFTRTLLTITSPIPF